MKKQFSQYIRTGVTVLVIVAIAALLIFLVTWSPSAPAEPRTPHTVTIRDIQQTLDASGRVVTQVIDGEDEKLIELYVDEDAIVRLAVDDEVQLDVDALDLEALDGHVYERSTEPRIVGDTVDYAIRVRFDEAPEDILNGMDADVRVVLDTVEDVLAVPNSSVYTVDDVYYVDILSEGRRVYLPRANVDKVAQEVTAREVTIGIEGDEYTEITEGLADGDVIALE